MKSFRVGVLVNDFNPEVGGAHNFVQAVASALPFGSIQESRLELVLISEGRKSTTRSKHSINVRRSRWIEAKLLMSYRNNSSLWLIKLLDRLNPINRVIRQNNIDFLLFLGSSAIPIPIPFGVIVWDVQHRTHPWFPELQHGWGSRDELARLVLTRASIVITGTDVGRDQLIKFYGVCETNIFIIPHPVPPDIEAFSRENFNSTFRFLYPAQFWPHKNHVVILEAMHKLKLAHTLAFQVIFVGSDKGNLAHIRELIDTYELSNFVEIKGFVSRAELLSLYREVDALVYSSFSGPENLPPLEAFMSSLPVIYSDFPGAREQLGNAALFFDPMDEERLAELFLELIANDVLKQTLISNGRAQLVGRSNFDFAGKVVELLLNFSLFRRSWK